MGLFSNLLGLFLRRRGGGVQAALLEAVVGMLTNRQSGGLSGLVNQFGAQGLGPIAESWVGTGKNLPITAVQIQHGLGNQAIGQLSQRIGIAPEQLASQLTTLLPRVVDRLTPQGHVPPAEHLETKGLELLKGLFK
ncbi:MAG: DUF937 domain-containing protein [Spirochaetes bacterium]|nr:DUF937 domain-containing protein [Spirochaetota bacterium]